jgi:hypothetical protein
VLRNAAIDAAACDPNVSPLDFLLSIMRNPTVSLDHRIKAAHMASVFVHPKPRAATNDAAERGELIDNANLFTIDLALAKRLRDDDVRLQELFQKEVNPKGNGGPFSAADEQERAMLHARVAETTKAIRCPPGYGAIEARKDRWRLGDFFYKRLTIRECGGMLTDAEDTEEAQLTALLAAFDQTPEGRARDRILKLDRLPHHRLSPTEQIELDILRELYPKLPPDPDDPVTKRIKALEAMAITSSQPEAENEKKLD